MRRLHQASQNQLFKWARGWVGLLAVTFWSLAQVPHVACTWTEVELAYEGVSNAHASTQQHLQTSLALWYSHLALRICLPCPQHPEQERAGGGRAPERAGAGNW